MKICKLYAKDDDKSYFTEVEISTANSQALGLYSQGFPVKEIFFRQMQVGALFDWHNAPQEQYIVYLSGKVEIQASGGEIKTFGAGDILLAADLTGMGHISKVLEPGKALIITTNN